MSSPSNDVVTGQVVSTGALITVSTVGKRAKEVIMNVGGVEARWQKSMADASAYKRLANGTGSLVTANGITPLAGGFSIGTDADINPGTATTIDYKVICE